MVRHCCAEDDDARTKMSHALLLILNDDRSRGLLRAEEGRAPANSEEQNPFSAKMNSPNVLPVCRKVHGKTLDRGGDFHIAAAGFKRAVGRRG